MTTNKLKLLYVEWQDACSNDKWMNEDEVEHWVHSEPYIVKQTGFIFSETDKVLILFNGIYDSEEYVKQYHQLIKIPKAWIRRRINLTKHIK